MIINHKKFLSQCPGGKKNSPGEEKFSPPLCPGEKFTPMPGKKKIARGRKKFTPLCPGEKISPPYARGKKNFPGHPPHNPSQENFPNE
jgi:hypothetical protein